MFNRLTKTLNSHFMIKIFSSLFFAGLLSLSQVSYAAQIKVGSLQRPLVPTTHVGQKIPSVLRVSAPQLHMLIHMTALLSDAVLYAPGCYYDASHAKIGEVLNLATAALGTYSLAYHKQDKSQIVFRLFSVVSNILSMYCKKLRKKESKERDLQKSRALMATISKIEKLIAPLAVPTVIIPLVWACQNAAFKVVRTIFLTTILRQLRGLLCCTLLVLGKRVFVDRNYASKGKAEEEAALFGAGVFGVACLSAIILKLQKHQLQQAQKLAASRL